MQLTRSFLVIVIIGTMAGIVEFVDDRALGFDDIGEGARLCFQGTSANMQSPPVEEFERNLRKGVERRGNRLVNTGDYAFEERDGLVTVARYIGGTQSERLIPCPPPPRPECQRWPGEFWAESVRRAAKYPPGKEHRPKNNAHYWAGIVVNAHGFTDAQGVWHPEPKNCVT